ncbi:MAG: 30S ribosomal protein S16, partial [Coriobacteriaceae bacterium]|nr:30S ribosomal protein S16 [Coriobacteriaceae bacterium]
MVVIRLARHGAKKHPFYRVVVADQHKKRDGRFIEQVGTYDPSGGTEKIDLDLEKIDEWMEKGAQPSDRVAKLITLVSDRPLPDRLAKRIELRQAKAEAEKKEQAAAEAKAAKEAAKAEKEAEQAAAEEAAAEEAPAEEAAAEAAPAAEEAA